MASSLSLVCFFLLLTTLLSSLQTHARDSQFFSKVSREPDETTIDANNDLNKNKENDVTPLTKQQKQPVEEQPAFLPQTTHTGYGLYGHETTLDAPSTATTTTTTTNPSSLYNMDDNKYENQNNFNSHNNREIIGNTRNEKSYVPELSGLSETSYTNNVGSSNSVAENNYNYDEVNQNGKNYQPELSDTSYTNNVGPSNSVAKYNYYNNNNEMNQNEKNYQPELSGLGETSSYTNNIGSSNYVNNNNNNNNNNEMFGTQNEDEKNNVAENNYNNRYYHNYVNNNNNNEMFGNTQKQDVGLSKYVGENNYYNNYKNNNGNAGRRYNGGVEKQGMSDTRYLENGKYFYDINAEKQLYPTNNNDISYTHNYNNNNNNNNGQLYGNRVNNQEQYYNNNYKYNGNGMQQEEEFEFDNQP